MSFDHKVAYKEVLNTFIYVKDTLVYVEVNGETIETTKEHPFWVEGQGWTKAKFLETGDQLRDANGNALIIDNVDIVMLPENQYTLVYNFEVADFHTYFVSDSDILVHNTKDCLKKISNAGAGDTSISCNSNKVKAWIKHNTYNDVRNKFGKSGADAFVKAMKKGFVGEKGQNGIKVQKNLFLQVPMNACQIHKQDQEFSHYHLN